MSELTRLQTHQWDRIKNYLETVASFTLKYSFPEEEKKEFYTYLKNNEFKLAWDVLYDVSALHLDFKIQHNFLKEWVLPMIQAATLMELDIRSGDIISLI